MKIDKILCEKRSCEFYCLGECQKTTLELYCDDILRIYCNDYLSKNKI